MWVTHLRSAVLSIITGLGKWAEIAIPMDPLYLSVLVSAEKKFWRCVQSGEVPHLINSEPPLARIEAIRIVDMTMSNSWAEFAALYRKTPDAFLDHERAKSELKILDAEGRQGGNRPWCALTALPGDDAFDEPIHYDRDRAALFSPAFSGAFLCLLTFF
jgi:hypothetical protein